MISEVVEAGHKRIADVRAGELTDIQMGLLTTIERSPGKVPLNGWPSGKVGKDLTEAFAPLLMGGLVYMRGDKTLELSEDGERALELYRNRACGRQT